MSTRIHFTDSDRKHYGFLDGVDDTSFLSNLRIQAAKVCTLPDNFLFTWRNTPVTLRQEATLKVNRCAKIVAENPKLLEVVIISTEKVVPISESKEKKNQSKTQQKVNEDPKPRTVSDLKCEEGHHIHTLKLFTNDEIENRSISRLEKERRCFWNNLAPKISSHPKYKQWSLQARKGIIDTEWTLRKTELLKIEAQQVLKNVRIEDKKDKTTEEEKRLYQNLDCMLKVDRKRSKTYKMIESLHKQLKYPEALRRSIETQIRENETTLDKLFTELKSTQNALEMTITHAKQKYRGKETPLPANDDLEQENFPELTNEEIKELSLSVLNDYEPEELSAD